MPPKSTWTNNELKKLYELRENGKTWREIGESFPHKSGGSCERKYSRTNWSKFLEDPNARRTNIAKVARWTHDEMIQLDAFIRAGKSYSFIAEEMDRSTISVERQAQQTDWTAWKVIKDIEEDDVKEDGDVLLQRLIDALLTISRHDGDRLRDLKEDYFLSRINLDKDKCFISFKELKEKAFDSLENLGFGNDEEITLGEGTYIVLGDSHGKHTKKDMFSLIRQANKYFKPKKIIHVGHMLDDDDDISYDWGSFKNLIVLAKVEELKILQANRNKFNLSFQIARECVSIGDLSILNQDLIQDFVITAINNVKSDIVGEKAIINSHRQEFFTRCCHEGVSYIASPGCVCERHIVRTVKQIHFLDGKHVKQAFPESFIKYRRQKQMYKYWEYGLLIIKVDAQGNHTVIPCPIRNTPNGFTFAYFDKMITSKGVYNPDKKIFINADSHSNNHDCGVLDIQEQIVKDYKPDVFVNLGDTHNCSSLNHHDMDKGRVIFTDYLDEGAITYYILKRMANWAKKKHIIYGNHERFARDFIGKFPQLAKYLDFPFQCDLAGLGYELTELKDVLKIGDSKYIHGDARMFGAPGAKIEKVARTFGRNTFVGHIHRTEIRFGCYGVGLTGQLDQEYNEPNSSNWVHGIGLCNQYKGKSWSTSIAIIDNICVINKTYKSVKPSNWTLKNYTARLVYDVK